MGMYTEFYFRGTVKDGPVADWLDSYINGEGTTPFDDSEFFTRNSGYWTMVFRGGGAVYQVSRPPVFQRPARFGPDRNTLTLASSFKGGWVVDAFIEWITPHLAMYSGEFLGYSLFEETMDELGPSDKAREHPTLYFVRRPEVRA